MKHLAAKHPAPKQLAPKQLTPKQLVLKHLASLVFAASLLIAGPALASPLVIEDFETGGWGAAWVNAGGGAPGGTVGPDFAFSADFGGGGYLFRRAWHQCVAHLCRLHAAAGRPAAGHGASGHRAPPSGLRGRCDRPGLWRKLVHAGAEHRRCPFPEQPGIQFHRSEHSSLQLCRGHLVYDGSLLCLGR